MTSMLRKFSQISPREKYFTVLANDQATWTVTNGTLHPLMTINDFTSATTPSTANLDAGYLLKDLGRTVVVYDPSNRNLHRAVFRQVQRVNSATTEGVGNINEIYYILVWAASGAAFDGQTVTQVARTG